MSGGGLIFTGGQIGMSGGGLSFDCDCCTKGCPTIDLGPFNLIVYDMVDQIPQPGSIIHFSALNHTFSFLGLTPGVAIIAQLGINTPLRTPGDAAAISISIVVRCMVDKWMGTVIVSTVGYGYTTWLTEFPAKKNAWPSDPWDLTLDAQWGMLPYPATPISIRLEVP